MQTIPLIKPDLPALDDVREDFEEILTNGKITNFGRHVAQFERETSEYLGAETVTVSSGTMGLVFSLLALGLKPGQKVILPSFTFMATAQAVLFARGVPVFADIGDDLTISPLEVEQLLAEHSDVGAVIAVHMYGLPARVHELTEIVDQASARLGRKVPLIFDGAHAFGASVDGTRVGAFGDAEVFSLSVTKTLVAVEGGLISTRSGELVERLRRMRNYGIQSDYNAHFPGMNGKMSEFHAIVGVYNLRRLDALLAERQTKARCYKQRIESTTPFRVTHWPANTVHTFKDLTILLPEGSKRAMRDAMIRRLAEQGVETRAYFCPPVHEQQMFSQFGGRMLDKTIDLAARVITLPFYTTMTSGEMDYVVECVQNTAKEVL